MRYNGQVVSIPQNADLTGADLGSALAVSASGRVNVAGANAQVVGYLVTPPNSSEVGSPVGVIVSGTVEAQVAANIGHGVAVKAAAGGHVAAVGNTPADGIQRCGITIESRSGAGPVLIRIV